MFLLILLLSAALLLALPAFPSAAAGEVTVKVSIAPCVRVCADGTLQSNIPAVTRQEVGFLLTVTPR